MSGKAESDSLVCLGGWRHIRKAMQLGTRYDELCGTTSQANDKFVRYVDRGFFDISQPWMVDGRLPGETAKALGTARRTAHLCNLPEVKEEAAIVSG